MRVDWFGLSDIGRVRETNEDSFAVVPPGTDESRSRLGTLLVVADGMGGANAGEVASALAVRMIPEAYFADPSTPDTALRRAVRSAGVAIYREAQARLDRAGMGTTVTAVAITSDRLVAANVGDSRAYLLRGEESRQITRDHSLVAELVAAGALSEAEAREDPRRNVITRVLGRQSGTPDLYSVELAAGDVVLLCTDGVHSLVSSQEMADLVKRLAVPEATRQLIALANDRGGYDNSTVVLARVA